MAVLAAFLFMLGDSVWKYRFHGQNEIGFLDLVRFWSLPTKIFVAMVLSFFLGGIAKLVTLYPLKEAELSSFLPLVIVFTILFLTLSGAILFKEPVTTKKAMGIMIAVLAIYLLK
jgi:multidrug transporter EmrE-like cation transporter